MKRSYKCTINLAAAIGILFCSMIFTEAQASPPREGDWWGRGEYYKNCCRLGEFCSKIDDWENYFYHHDQWAPWLDEAEERIKKFLTDPNCWGAEWALRRLWITQYWEYRHILAVCTCFDDYRDNYRDIMYENHYRPEFLNFDIHKKEVPCFETIETVIEVSKGNMDIIMQNWKSGKFRLWGKTIYPVTEGREYKGKWVPELNKPSPKWAIDDYVARSLLFIFNQLEEYYQHILRATLNEYELQIRDLSLRCDLWGVDVEEAVKWELWVYQDRYDYRIPVWCFLDNFLSQTSKEDYYEAIRGVAEVQKRVLEAIEEVGWCEGVEYAKRRLQEKYGAITEWQQRLSELGEVRVIASYPLSITYTGPGEPPPDW